MKEYPLSKVPSQQKIVRNAPTPRTKSNVKNKRHFNNTSNDIKTAALGPIAEPIGIERSIKRQTDTHTINYT